VDVINGVPVTLIDNGMPCVVMKAQDVGITGYEDREARRQHRAEGEDRGDPAGRG
jgi:2-methylaconitate cis-trans-isomerase PrpF